MSAATSYEHCAYTLATGRLFCDFAAFHEYAEELAQRPILTHEFADRALWDELRAEFEDRAVAAVSVPPNTPKEPKP